MLETPCCSEQKKYPVSEQMRKLQEELDKTDKTLGLLFDRLLPVLSSAPVPAGSEVSVPESPICELAGRIKDKLLLVHSINARLERILDTIEI